MFYGVDGLPGLDEPASGGIVKFQRLAAELPNAPRDFNLLYLGSSSRPPDTRQLVWLARRRGAPFVWNQNGVAYPAWAGRATGRINRPLARALHAADFVFFQSEFCKLSADRFLGERQGPWEVLYNPVDTRRFTPGPRRGRGLTLLLGGSQHHRYRLEVALRTVAELARERSDVRLLVTGALSFAAGREAERTAGRLISALGLSDRVELLGAYSQGEAPALLRRADLMLHTQFNDACPGAVVEAMACGLPVVYSASGGVPELVGDEAGVGVPAPLDFERLHPPSPGALVEAVLTVAERLEEYAAAARERAVSRFDVGPWLQRHREVFEGLLR